MAQDVARRRVQMGEGLAPWVRPGVVHEVGPASWIYLSGAALADLNMAVVYEDDPAGLAHALKFVEAMGCPAVVMLAGAGRALAAHLAGEWAGAGETPLMWVDLADTELRADPRVRRAGPADDEIVSGIVADSFGVTPEIARVIIGVLFAASDTAAVWVLDDEGQAVSTVTTSLVGDAVTVWSMGTPERFRRRGHARALLAAVLDTARTAGASVGLLGATPAGRPLYESTGWRELETWQIFANAKSAQFPPDSP